MLVCLISFALVTGCGGGNSTPSTQASAPVALSNPAAPAAATLPGAAAPAAGEAVAGSDAGVSALIKPPSKTTLTVTAGLPITSVTVQNIGDAQQRVPVTFGQVFAPGHLLSTQTLSGRLADGTSVALQVDAKAKHADGSIRHAIISAILPSLAAGQTATLALVPVAQSSVNAGASPSALLSAGFNADVTVRIDNVDYVASASKLLASGKVTPWLAGPLVNEWLVSAPLTSAAGVAHPHLSARFAIRAVSGSSQARVDVVVENDWAYEPAPQNFIYNAQVKVGSNVVYSKDAMTHFHHARWRKTFWWGATPQVHVKHDIDYLIATRAVANYDRSFAVDEATLANVKTKWAGAITEPMSTGFASGYMPMTGGREDIGLMPAWTTEYLLTMDKRAKDATLGTADLAGSYSSHYRNKTTDRPVTLAEFPYMTIGGRSTDTYNPATQKYEGFPACATGADCNNVNTHDTAHQPAFAYLPYLVTGDYYYLEELQFWAMYNTFQDNPNYRGYGKGWLSSDQGRGQAWSLRTLAEAAYITPDADPLKAPISTLLANNLDWYVAQYPNNPDANKLGIITTGYAVGYNGNTGVAPWQDDFFTSAVGHAVDLGFTKAQLLLSWKAKFPISRMVDPGACWINASTYVLLVRDTESSPFYPDLKTAMDKTIPDNVRATECGSAAMASVLGIGVNEMVGYSEYTAGYPSNMQPALAYAVQVSGATGATAWTKFMSRTNKPNYATGPQFAIVPRL